MVDESLYLTTHETALAVVATAMKKARLRVDTLFVNSFIGGILFTSGGMLFVMIHSYCPQLVQDNPGIVSLLQGAMYPIGLFYVVIMGVDLFNSNVLFFSTAICRNAVSIVDLLISWFISYWGNLVGTIFVCYVICNYSGVSQEEAFITGSREITLQKCSFSFVENLIKGIAGNFFVCLGIYLQLMAKPLHVKLILMGLPIFTFVSMGFTHSVADMYMLIIGLINHAPVSVGEVAWKVMLPGALGNIIGGSFFGIVITWYLHLVVVERDQRELNLPRYEVRDEQPELNMDSRVVRQVVPEVEETTELFDEKNSMDENEQFSSSHSPNSSQFRARPLYDDDMVRTSNELNRVSSRLSTVSRMSMKTLNPKTKSPKNVFPVYGMGAPSRRESQIASGRSDEEEDDIDNEVGSIAMELEDEDEGRGPSAAYIGEQLKKVLSRKKTSPKSKNSNDLENQHQRSASMLRRPSTSSIRTRFRSRGSRASLAEWNSRLERANISPRAAAAADNVAGVDPLSVHYRGSQSSIARTSTRSQSQSKSPGSKPMKNVGSIDSEIDPISFQNADIEEVTESNTPNNEFSVKDFEPEKDLGDPDSSKDSSTSS